MFDKQNLEAKMRRTDVDEVVIPAPITDMEAAIYELQQKVTKNLPFNEVRPLALGAIMHVTDSLDTYRKQLADHTDLSYEEPIGGEQSELVDSLQNDISGLETSIRNLQYAIESNDLADVKKISRALLARQSSIMFKEHYDLPCELLPTEDVVENLEHFVSLTKYLGKIDPAAPEANTTKAAAVMYKI